MKIWKVLRESVKVYAKNFAELMTAFLIELVLRAMCLTPLMLLLAEGFEMLAWLCVPMYVLIALPARQNYALAMQDMLHGGSVLTPRLISTAGYWHKLGRALLGTLKMLLWSLPALLAVVIMYQIYKGEGALAAEVMGRMGVNGRDGFSVMRWFGLFGSDTIDGFKNILLIIVAACGLPVIGCAWHCGVRHAAALEDRKLLKGQRLRLVALWVLSLLAFLPFAAVTVGSLSGVLSLSVSDLMNAFLFKQSEMPELGERLYVIGAAFVVLFLPAIPFKQLVPAVAVHQQMLKEYKEIKTDVEA